MVRITYVFYARRDYLSYYMTGDRQVKGMHDTDDKNTEHTQNINKLLVEREIISREGCVLCV